MFIIAAAGRKTPAAVYNNKIIQELGYYNRSKVDAAIKEMQTPSCNTGKIITGIASCLLKTFLERCFFMGLMHLAF